MNDHSRHFWRMSWWNRNQITMGPKISRHHQRIIERVFGENSHIYLNNYIDSRQDGTMATQGRLHLRDMDKRRLGCGFGRAGGHTGLVIRLGVCSAQ